MQTTALKLNTMTIPNQNSMKNEMIYFDHQWGSSRIPYVWLRAREIVAMKTVPK